MRRSLFIGGFALLALSTAAMADLADPGVKIIGHDPAAISIGLIGNLQPGDPDIYFENTTPYIVDLLTFTTTIAPINSNLLTCSGGGYFKGGLIGGFNIPSTGCEVIHTSLSPTAEKVEYVFGGVNPSDGDEFCKANGQPNDAELNEKEGIPPCGIFEAQLIGFTPQVYGMNPQTFQNAFFVTPEPSTAALLLGQLGLFFGIVLFMRRRKSAALVQASSSKPARS